MMPVAFGFQSLPGGARAKSQRKKQQYLTPFQWNCANWLYWYAGIATRNWTGPRIAEAAKLICIRDGLPYPKTITDWSLKKK